MIDYTLPLEDLPDPLPIEPLTRPFDVTITPPGSKSITCRAYVLAALAKGESRIIRPLRAEDTDLLLDALCTLGAEARWEGEDAYITGVNGKFPRGGEVNLGDGGTPTRFMIACACLAAEPVVVDGSPRMRERPIAEGVDMLRQLGAKIEYVEEEGRLPVRVVPSEDFKGGELTIGRTASSQFVSAVMLIAPSVDDGIRVQFNESPTSASYLRLTKDVLLSFGARCGHNPLSHFSKNWLRSISIQSQQLTATTLEVDADASSTVYWVLATKLTPSAKVTILPLRPWSSQPDLKACFVLDRLGGTHVPADMDTGMFFDCDTQSRRSAMNVDCNEMPDGGLSLAAGASMCHDVSTLTGLHTLRVKETDRIAALANELRKVGCEVETTDDSITITPVGIASKQRARDDESNPPAEPGANGGDRSESGGTGSSSDPIIIETYNDHRMAMAFAVLGLAAPGGHTLAIRNPACVRKSYPTFWKDFAKLYQ